MEPMLRVGKSLDFFLRHADKLENLKLIGQASRLRVELALFRLARISGRVRLLLGFGFCEIIKVGSKHLHLADELVGRGLDQLCLQTTHLDGHAGRMVAKWEENILPP
jgi:hypothetical protein